VREDLSPFRWSLWYASWVVNRLYVIQNHYGIGWFPGKRVLEVGCGTGGIGAHFASLGADVLSTDASPEYVEKTRAVFGIPTRVVDLDKGWPFRPDEFDLILNMGVLYHVKDPRSVILASCKSAPRLVVESLCTNFEKPVCQPKTEEGFDKAFGKVGADFSPAYVEGVLRVGGMRLFRVSNGLNTPQRRYDWEPDDKGPVAGDLRRFWFCERSPLKERIL
jgi:SAM-dependent methyltransferase